MKNGIVLITYADSLGGDLRSLRSCLNRFFPGCLSGIHLLPFFPSSGDRGFSPIRYDEIDPAFGTWNDLADLGADYEIMADFMVNHISRQSMYFKDWLQNEDRSEYAGLFLPVERIFGTETPSAEDTSTIYRRQPREPWLTIDFPSGRKRKIWCTFSEEQIDIDISSEAGLSLFNDNLKRLSKAGIRMLRLDAVGYITKKRGTSCFMVEPDIWNILESLSKSAAEYGISLLPEMHEHYTIQMKLSSKGYPVYDFAMPLLLLYAWYAKDFGPLKHWLTICPRKQFTTLDTHDGIGVVDAADLLTREQTDFTVDELYKRGSNVKKKYSSSEYQNLDIYQINCTYYSAVGENDDAYLLARAVQFFAPGTPQIYYVGMLAGRNDLELVERTRNGRDINRHDYTEEEIEGECKRPVVTKLQELMRFRMTNPAFDGEFELLQDEDPTKLGIRRTNGKYTAILSADLSTSQFSIQSVVNGNSNDIII